MKKLIPIILILVSVSLAIFFIARPKQNKPSSSLLPASTQNRITISGKGLNEIESSTAQESNTYKPLMNEVLASKITMRQLSHIKRRGNQDILVFKDGSELIVTNYIKKQLSGEILYRLELGSGKLAGARHGN